MLVSMIIETLNFTQHKAHWCHIYSKPAVIPPHSRLCLLCKRKKPSALVLSEGKRREHRCERQKPELEVTAGSHSWKSLLEVPAGSPSWKPQLEAPSGSPSSSRCCCCRNQRFLPAVGGSRLAILPLICPISLLGQDQRPGGPWEQHLASERRLTVSDVVTITSRVCDSKSSVLLTDWSLLLTRVRPTCLIF